jgi:hypothetical protein
MKMIIVAFLSVFALTAIAQDQSGRRVWLNKAGACNLGGDTASSDAQMSLAGFVSIKECTCSLQKRQQLERDISNVRTPIRRELDQLAVSDKRQRLVKDKLIQGFKSCESSSHINEPKVLEYSKEFLVKIYNGQ